MSLNRPARQSARPGRFRPGLRLTLFVLVFLPLTVALGSWQLSRSAEKLALMESYLDHITRLPVVPDAHTDIQPFMRLKLSGRLSSEIFLVDNQVRDRKPGYWAVQVLVQEGGDRWLLNRGYFAAPQSRDQLPQPPFTDAQVTVVGVVWPYTGLIPLLADDPWTATWPQRVQRLNTARMAETTGARNFEIRLEQSDLAPQPAPFAAVLTNQKHLGYAATWFGLALALVVLYLVSGWRRREQSEDAA